ncbi:pilus assembly protein TadG-related protein [Thioclava sp. F36-6]|uniref:pilus assembly protein TadG-related protein n=1 Tax=Thioclava sp. F36-6 TaxID=1915316 RepID=UPI00143A7F56|nr:pilus assembly protein TadG-related protein [Thioclava sp. F36-6]
MNRVTITDFTAEEDGMITQLSLFWTILFLAVGSLALDVSNGYRNRVVMQDAADAAALGAMYLSSDPLITKDEAKTRAAQLAHSNLASDDGTSVITKDDVTFGYYDATNHRFVTDYAEDLDLSPAVRVMAHRTTERANAAPTFFGKVIGQDGWQINTGAVAEAYQPACLTEGLAAKGVIDLQSGNSFASGFCLYAAQYVSLNQNNLFESGAIVSMPDTSKLDIPASGFTKNDGLQEALRTSFYKLRVLDRIPKIIQSMRDGTGYLPAYITNRTPTVLTGTKLETTDFTPGNLYVLDCNSSVTISVPSKVDDTVTTDPAVISEVAVIADCPVKFGNGVALENAIFANTSTDDRSFSAPQGLRIGRDDNCAPDGGAKLITMGGVSSAAKISFFGGQILAVKDVSFSAQADGIEGVAIVSGGKIDGTSNSRFGHCDTGMEGNIEMSYFRLRM